MGSAILEWWPAVELLFLASIFVANRWFCLSAGLETRVRRVGSEKARVGLRTALYGSVIGLTLLFFSVENIARGEQVLGVSRWVVFGIAVGGGFAVAMFKTAGEDLPSE